jgi:hypothetical protein
MIDISGNMFRVADTFFRTVKKIKFERAIDSANKI